MHRFGLAQAIFATGAYVVAKFQFPKKPVPR